jgi:hypothetical protein
MKNDEGSDRPSIVSAFPNKRVDIEAETKEKKKNTIMVVTGKKFRMVAGRSG